MRDDIKASLEYYGRGVFTPRNHVEIEDCNCCGLRNYIIESGSLVKAINLFVDDKPAKKLETSDEGASHIEEHSYPLPDGMFLNSHIRVVSDSPSVSSNSEEVAENYEEEWRGRAGVRTSRSTSANLGFLSINKLMGVLPANWRSKAIPNSKSWGLLDLTDEEISEIRDYFLSQMKGFTIAAVAADHSKNVEYLKDYFKDYIVYESNKFYNMGHPGSYSDNYLTYLILEIK